MANKKNILRTSVAAAAVAAVTLSAAPAAAGLLGPTPTTSTAGPVKPMYGNLRPFYGNLRPFYGNLRPFYGNLRPFWGNLRPFWGDTGAFYGDLKTFWGVDNPVVGTGAPAFPKVADFWTKAGGDWQTAFTSVTSTAPDYALVAGQLNTIYADSATFWGAAVQAKTGKSFDDGFLKPFLAAHGIDPNDPASYATLDQNELAYLFVEYYDGLMNFTGTDHVDHWMRTIHWSPALAHSLANGPGASIGILDQTLTANEFPNGQVVQFHGNTTFSDGHGAAVASLLVGAHDGQGVMGMVPDARVYAYNPFDSTGTANWDEVTAGVRMLKNSGASVVNMSLGVPGSTFDPGWNNVFANLQTTLILKNTVFVVAAGNEGATQTQNVNWLPINPAILVVGSVDLDGNISNFSNRPGEACLTTLGLFCLPGNKLKDRFLVAPGELILVSDGMGGTTRQIGTSFAAPLVTGAVALIHQRWPWLKNFPNETANIILDSATDLGAPGVDAVYGHGLLNVEASQAPLNFNNLIWYTIDASGQKRMQTQSGVLQTYQAEKQKAFSTDGMYFYAFEPLSLLAYRDFAIPLSQKLVGQDVRVQGVTMPLQAYLRTRMDVWASSKSGYAGPSRFVSGAMPLANPWGADMTMSFSPRQAREGFRDEGPAFQTRLDITGERSHVTVGFGDGAPALFAQSGFTQAADYEAERGGANPLLGLASGGAYAAWTYSLSDKLQISTGALLRDEVRDRRLLPALGYRGNGAESYAADATHVSVAYAPVAGLTLTGAYTRLREASGLLGVQSFDPADFRKGSTTDGYSVSLNWAASPKLSLMATGTMGRTQGSHGQALAVDKAGLTSSAFEVGVARSDLFAAGDRLQVSVSQPMFVEKGRINFQSVQVVDRETGELGVVNQSLDIAGKRRLAGEALYLRSLDGGRSDVAFFGRVEGATTGATDSSYIAGARYRFAF